MTYRITYKGKTVKEYPHKLTCIIWLILKGLVYENYRWGKWIDPDYKIKKVKDDCFTCPRCHSRRCNTGKTRMGFFKVKCLDCKNQWEVRVCK